MNAKGFRKIFFVGTTDCLVLFLSWGQKSPFDKGEVRRTDGYLIIDIFAVGDFDLQENILHIKKPHPTPLLLRRGKSRRDGRG